MLESDIKPLNPLPTDAGSAGALFNKMQLVFNTTPGANLLLSPNLIVEAVSDDYLVTTHANRECLLDRPLLEVLLENPQVAGTQIIDNLQASLEQVLATGQPHDMDRQNYNLLTQSGHYVECHLQIRNRPILDATNRVRYIIHSVINVTETIQTESQLRHSQEQVNRAQLEAEKQRQRLERLFMQAPTAICILNGPDLVYELVNPVYQQLAPGYTQLGKSFMEGFPEKEAHPLYRKIRQVYTTGIPHEERNMLIPLFRPSDGALENHYFNFIVQTRLNEYGTVDGILIFAFDVTDQIESRKAVEASAQKLRLVTDALPVLIGYLDKEERYQFANKAYETWFNRKPEELLGQPIRNVVGEKAYKEASNYMKRALKGERLNFEATMHYREDFTKHVCVDYVPDVQEDTVVGFYTMVTDITDQVEARKSLELSVQQAKMLAKELASANENLQLTNHQLRHTNVDLDNFIYTASHDLKAPILNIEGLINAVLRQLSAEGSRSESIQEIIDLILVSIQRFKRTINHLTEISKLQKENVSDTSLVNLLEVIEDVQSDLTPFIKAAQAEIKVNKSTCPTIYFSQKNLRSIIYNLISNAIKYRSPDRTLQVQLYCYTVQDYLVLAVQDNGLGIEASQQHKLFIMFNRLHNHVEGTGVGLYMVKKIIENAGGKIEVQSTAGKGTTFKVYFRLNS